MASEEDSSAIGHGDFIEDVILGRVQQQWVGGTRMPGAASVATRSRWVPDVWGRS